MQLQGAEIIDLKWDYVEWSVELFSRIMNIARLTFLRPELNVAMCRNRVSERQIHRDGSMLLPTGVTRDEIADFVMECLLDSPWKCALKGQSPPASRSLALGSVSYVAYFWLLLLVLGCFTPAWGAPTELRPDGLSRGIQLFEAAEFEKAVKVLQVVQADRPNDSICAMWLARAYGRLAEQSNWLHALEYARQTRHYLELAVALDPKNREARADLRDYYARAPGFLGGSASKSELQTRALERLDAGSPP